MIKKYSTLLKVAAVLWFVWGAVHIFAGAITDYLILSGDISAAVGGIADAINPDTLQMNYPDASGAVIGQHGFNLLWIGLTTLISSFYVWKGNKNAILLAALTGGLADLGYFLFMDLGGYVHFLPGTLLTIVSGFAIALSGYAYFKSR